MSGYTQLTREQRYQIHALMKMGQNQPQMARVVGYIRPRSVGKSGATGVCVAIGPTKPITWPKPGR